MAKISSLRSSFCPMGMVALLVSPISTAMAAADDSASALEEVVITAQRREENLQKTSLALQVVSTDQLDNAGVTQVRDLVAVVPGLMIGQGSSATQIYIRGVGDFGSTPITNPAVAFNVDGVYIARPQAVEGNFFDVARVEVLKGPQGTLYGRNASGGAINVITNRPNMSAFSAAGELEIGNYNSVVAEGAVNVPVNDQFALRGAFQVANRDGYLTQNGDDQDRESARLQALWKNDSVSALLVGSYTKAEGAGPAFTLLGGPVTGATTPWTATTDPAVISYIYKAGAAQQGGCVPSFFFPTVVNPGQCPPGLTAVHTAPSGPTHQNNTLKRIHAEIAVDLGWSTLTVLPAYQTANINNAAAPGGATYQLQPSKSDATSLEARLGNNSESIKWVVGLFYFEEKQNADELIDGGLILNSGTISKQKTESTAAFGELTYSITDTTRIIAGGRYTRDRKTTDGDVTAIYPSLLFLPPSPCFFGLPTSPCPLESFHGDKTFSKFTWKVGVERDLTDHNMLFATLSTGFKAGGFNESSGSTPGSTEASSFDPETLTALELGSRNRFLDNRLQVNAEAYYWKYKDHQEPRQSLDGQGLLAFSYENAGDATIYGLDLDVIAKLSKVDTLHVAVAYLHSNFDSFTYQVPANPALGGPPFIKGYGNGYSSLDPLSPLALNTTCKVTGINSGLLAGGQNVDCSGKPLTRAPEWSGSVGYEHVFDLGNDYSIVAGAEAQFSSSRYLAIDFLPIENADSYIAANARLTLLPRSEKWALTVFGRNLSNEAIYTSGIQSIIAGIVAANISAPRTYGIRAKMSF